MSWPLRVILPDHHSHNRTALWFVTDLLMWRRPSILTQAAAIDENASMQSICIALPRGWPMTRPLAVKLISIVATMIYATAHGEQWQHKTTPPCWRKRGNRKHPWAYAKRLFANRVFRPVYKSAPTHNTHTHTHNSLRINICLRSYSVATYYTSNMAAENDVTVTHVLPSISLGCE